MGFFGGRIRCVIPFLPNDAVGSDVFSCPPRDPSLGSSGFHDELGEFVLTVRGSGGQNIRCSLGKSMTFRREASMDRREHRNFFSAA